MKEEDQEYSKKKKKMKASRILWPIQKDEEKKCGGVGAPLLTHGENKSEKKGERKDYTWEKRKKKILPLGKDIYHAEQEKKRGRRFSTSYNRDKEVASREIGLEIEQGREETSMGKKLRRKSLPRRRRRDS